MESIIPFPQPPVGYQEEIPDISELTHGWNTLPPEDQQCQSNFAEHFDYGVFLRGLRVLIQEKNAPPGIVVKQAPLKKPKQKAGRKPSQLALLAPYPTELTRCSPFFPSTPKDQKVYYPENIMLADNAWGTVTYRGPRLSTSHEDLLLVVLAAIADHGKRREDQHDGLKTYTYVGSLRELLVARGNKNPNSRDYDAAFEMFEDMAGAVVSVRSRQGAGRGFASLIIGGKRTEDGSFSVTVNPYFAEMYSARRVTWSDVRIRMQIRSPYGKAVYRFISGHSSSWAGNLITLAQSINMPTDVTPSVLRERLIPAINELISHGILGKGSAIAGTRVVLQRGKKLDVPLSQISIGQAG